METVYQCNKCKGYSSRKIDKCLNGVAGSDESGNSNGGAGSFIRVPGENAILTHTSKLEITMLHHTIPLMDTPWPLAKSEFHVSRPSLGPNDKGINFHVKDADFEESGCGQQRHARYKSKVERLVADLQGALLYGDHNYRETVSAEPVIQNMLALELINMLRPEHNMEGCTDTRQWERPGECQRCTMLAATRDGPDCGIDYEAML